jgi:hypothetical protein
LVLPPTTESVAARQTLMTASRRDNVDGIDHLLTSAATTDESLMAHNGWGADKQVRFLESETT